LKRPAHRRIDGKITDREADGGPRLPRQLGTVGRGRTLIMESQPTLTPLGAPQCEVDHICETINVTARPDQRIDPAGRLSSTYGAGIRMCPQRKRPRRSRVRTSHAATPGTPLGRCPEFLLFLTISTARAALRAGSLSTPRPLRTLAVQRSTTNSETIHKREAKQKARPCRA
jgi:hypothetical protein